MDSVNYFGYGSLVNRQTRPSDEHFEPTSVAGWQRSWSHRVKHTDAASLALVGEPSQQPPLGFSVLTVVPLQGAQIDGVLVSIDAADLPKLDQREQGYSRHIVQSVKSTEPVAMYVSKTAQPTTLPSDYPLLQSYVDCVLAGFLAVFGWAGVDRFFATTEGWSTPMLADRATPLYPRAITLPADVAAIFDERIAKVR